MIAMSIDRFESIPAFFFYALPGAYLVATLLGAVLIDTAGRRILLLVGAVGMCLTNVYIAATFTAKCSSREHRNGSGAIRISIECDAPFDLIVVAASVLFVTFFSLSWGLVCWMYPIDIFSIHNRAKAVAVSATTSLFMRCVFIQDALMSASGAFIVSVVASIGVVAYLRCPETRDWSSSRSSTPVPAERQAHGF